ncbi:MAG: asparagine synthase (glutamine-hydrolyzing) [Bdellovibrionales bacterium]|nr:asparagine synthase (glutamine-hydrolyzing) [Bdellovibrionales bacterium]
MCGIAGILSNAEPPSEAELRAMAESLRHRGPDAMAVSLLGHTGLAHTRLSIIDTREIGRQPLKDTTGNYVIVYNGEVYNFSELRRQLEQDGARFRTNTDTEVVLEAYKRWGQECVKRFIGMFAFAIWDQTKHQLFLARDRMGQKPLFYAELRGGGIIFASELKAILASGRIERRLNLRTLNSFLATNYGLGEESFIDRVKKLPPASTLLVEYDGSFKLSQYWSLEDFFQNKRSFPSTAHAVEEFDSLLLQSVQARLISDVPLGAFLSGGIDSSAISAAMTRLREPAQNKTFSIGFKERTYSELPEARKIADFLGVQHRDEIVDADMAAILQDLVYYSDEPFADTSIIPVYYLCKFARESVTVCLSGDGGDEILGGYTTYIADKLNHFLRWVPRGLFSSAHGAVRRLIKPSFGKVSFDYKLRHFLRGANADSIKAHFAWREICGKSERRSLLNPDVWSSIKDHDPLDVFYHYAEQVRGCSYLDQSMYVDIKTWLVDDILVKIDRGSMAHSLEARAPFLDHRLVEFAASLPVDLKINGLNKKYILRKSQEAHLPPSTINRKKEGFNAPISHWLLKSSLKSYYDELRETPSSGAGLLQSKVVDGLWRAHAECREDNSLKLFALIVFDQWCKRFEIAV